ncbi:Ca2+-dependent phosphoinositide-specific phospholipase C [Arachidicoccus soli]|uniref:Phosphatidylinositol diacylglycerol-lyase n=1 Tax=Arachidicoccus soli TaxID=2341117 RepID=A0A386HNC0_9BACT|nr:Ca2+-dependent phosphoinositide-specific phospholipase C [Arachidicoccus soli]AYD47408.1 hypothetical protein D6B99_07165 [Arachidicoccus soli]
MQSYQNLPYNLVSFKASHNSYDRNEKPLGKQLDFNNSPKTYFNCGCRGLELDIWRHSKDNPNEDGWFTVNHLTNSGGDKLSHWLNQILDWHDNNQEHDVIWINLDIKSSLGDKTSFPNEIDNYLTNFFDKSIILTPNLLFPQLTQDIPLSVVVEKSGWPLLKDMSGKFIFCLSGTESWKSYYSECDPTKRLCLSDCSDKSKLTHHNARVVFNASDPTIDFSDLKSKNILVRLYNLNNEKSFNKAIQEKVNILSTNKISNCSWAAMTDREPYMPFLI